MGKYQMDLTMELGSKLCNALGIDPGRVAEMQRHFRPGHLVEIEMKFNPVSEIEKLL